MAICRKILIAGFSGAGKSTLLGELRKTAPATWNDFSDLDQIILKKYGNGKRVLAELIESVGWDTFRLWESQEIKTWAKAQDQGVLALGGGSLTQDLLDSLGKQEVRRISDRSAPFEVCFQRLQADTTEPRPLLSKGKTALLQIYIERQQLLSKISWTLHNGSETSPQDLAGKFWSEV